ncbi:MAG: ArsC family reductase [Pseudomonadales bacterium]
MLTLFGIKNCDSVKKARKWLEAQSIDYVFHDFRSDGLESAVVETWLDHIDWNLVLNRRSTTWKQLSDEQREGVTRENVTALLVEFPTLVKRPVAVHKKGILVGFKQADYELLSKS